MVTDIVRAAIGVAACGWSVVATAQTVIDGRGIRTPGAVIDARGVHTPGGSVNGAGVVAAGAGPGVTILTNGSHRTVDCRGGGLTVNGNGNLLTAVNCRTVVVAGNGNLVSVRFAAPGRVSVVGNDNKLRWQAPRGVAVSVSVVGHRDTVSRSR